MNELIIISIFVLIVGACIGSFLNVVALRAISNESIVLPPSKCPSCGTKIKWYDNIPVISYFLLKGKCRSCGCKISIQYPIVEALSALLFLVIVLAFGFSVKSLLLLILLSLAIVLSITDFKEENTYTAHLILFIVFSVISALYFQGINNYLNIFLGLISGIITMELLARGSYYLLKRKPLEKNPENVNNSQDTDKEESIDNYIQKKKRTFGEGDTYIAAAAGALLGWKYIIFTILFAVVIQALCIIPSFISGLYKQKEYKLLISLSLFLIASIIYWILFNVISYNALYSMLFIFILGILAFYTLRCLQNVIYNNGVKSIPFGPALLFTTFLVFFFGRQIVDLLIKHIWFIMS